MAEIPTFKLHVGGKSRDAKSGRAKDVMNPATGEACARVAWGGKEDALAALEAGRAAFPGWAATDGGKRADLLRRLSDLVKKNLEEIARLESAQVGKPVRESRLDIGYVAASLAYYAGLADKIEGRTVPVPGPRFNLTVREPLGVTVHIAPWNYPLLLAVRGIAPALAAGNTVVLKPATWTPLTALRFGELAKEAGLPDGVVNAIAGPGSEVGNVLAGSPQTDSVTFTGSVETGREVARLASQSVTPVTLELGGKSPQVVLPDADVERAVKATVLGIFQNAGQMCWATSRLLVHESIADDYLRKVKEKAEALKMGDPLADDTEMGPLVRREHRDTVESFIAKGRAEGAKLLTGGGVPKDPALAKGAYLQPTVFTDVPRTSTIAREEIFGPVLVAFRFKTTEEALAIANETRFGLFASVWTRSIPSAFQFAQKLESGIVGVNEAPITFPQTPFTGWKESGVGSEQGSEAILAYTRVKNITFGLR